MRMKALCAGQKSGGLLFRLNLLQLFVEVFGGDLQQSTSHWDTADARERLELLLKQTPMAELLEISFEGPGADDPLHDAALGPDFL